MKEAQQEMTTEEMLFDLSMIDTICRGNREKKQKMIHTFLCTIPAAVHQIKEAYQATDLRTISELAHQIKPTLAIYAITILEYEIGQIEYLAKNGFYSDQLGGLITALDSTIGSVTGQMKQQLITQ